MPSRLKTALALGACGVIMAASSPAAQAADDPVGSGRIPCKGSSTADVRLRVEPDGDGRFSVVGVVYSDDSDAWTWRMIHNTEVSYRGEVQAAAADRSFRIQRFMVDIEGVDVIAFRAVNSVTDEVCRAEVSV